MKKKVLLICIIAFPSLIYFVFELTQANFKKMAYFGPKSVDAKGDTVYWSVPDYVRFCEKTWIKRSTDTIDGSETKIMTSGCEPYPIDTLNYPVYTILFLDSSLKRQGYKLEGLYDYINYKKKDLIDVPLFIVADFDPGLYTDTSVKAKIILDSLKINISNLRPLFTFFSPNRKAELEDTYFKQKPAYVFDYFMVLVDKRRHIRGYYDPSFNAEVKRMIQEYKHLKIRDEYAQTLKKNDIKQNEK